jgi:hypothetical protein
VRETKKLGRHQVPCEAPTADKRCGEDARPALRGGEDDDFGKQ